MSTHRLVLGIILAAGFVLRLIGLRFGLPEIYHADEPMVVNHAMAYGTGDLNPHFFQIPPLVSYLLFVVYGFYFIGGWIVGKFSGPGAFADLFLTDPTSFYVLGRFLLGTLTGTATILALYFLAKRMVSQRVGLWAAACLSVCFLHVRDSHYIYTDIPLCLALVATLLMVERLYRRGLLKDYIWAGGMIGLCASIKYNAVLVGGSYLVAHLLRDIPLRAKLFSKSFWAGVGACLGVFVLTNPFALLDFSFFCGSFFRQVQAQSFVGWLHHGTYSLGGGIGGLAVVAALAGIGLSLYSKNVKTWIVLGFVLPFYFGITWMGQPHDRYVLPLIPFALMFAALFVQWTLDKMGLQRRPWVWVGFAAFLVFPMALKSAYSDWLFLQPDSRTLAKRWIEANIPSGTKIALDHTFYVPKLMPTQEQLQEKRQSAQAKEASAGQKQKKLERLINLAKPGERRYNLYFLSDEPQDTRGYLFGEPRIPFDFDRIQKEGIRVVVSHRLGAWKSHFDFFALVEQNCKDVHRFSPYRAVWRDFSMEPQVRTGGAFLWPEMLARRSNGEHITIYVMNAGET